jgi:hypothetical protein
VRVHPGEDYRLVTAVVEDDEDRETYLVAPHLRGDLGAEVLLVTLFTAITRQGVLFLWPCKVPGDAGRKNHWHESALSAAEYSMKRWVRVAADMSLGAYQMFAAAGDVPEPEWPDRSFHEILKIAFRDRYIESIDHPVVKRLRGLV